jgi:hypothetical protein
MLTCGFMRIHPIMTNVIDSAYTFIYYYAIPMLDRIIRNSSYVSKVSSYSTHASPHPI